MPEPGQERAPTERLINLIVTLTSSRRPRSFAELRRATDAYKQDDPQSARRMFERDKDALRTLGVPIQSVEIASDDAVGYLIDPDDYQLPAIQLDRDEVTALALGIAMAGGQQERLALSKVVALSPDPVEVTPPPLRLHVSDDAIDTVADAVTQRATIEFGYRRSDGDEQRRRVDPWAVGVHNGIGYLIGFDHLRQERRTFRLSRVTSKITVVGEPAGFQRPASLDLADALRARLAEAMDVEVLVGPMAVGELVQHGGHLVDDDGHDEASGDAWRPGIIPDADPARLGSWLLSASSRVVVMGPRPLRDSVVATLSQIAGDRQAP